MENPWPIRIAAMFISLVGGVILIAALLSEDIILWERITIICMGVCAFIAGRVVWAESSAKCVWIDLSSKEVVIDAYKERNLWHWRIKFNQINCASVSVSLDEDGFAVYRPCLLLDKNGEVPLSADWRLSRDWAMKIADSINELLNRNK
jgi:hypothetical protein